MNERNDKQSTENVLQTPLCNSGIDEYDFGPDDFSLHVAIFSRKFVSTSRKDNIHTRRYFALSKSLATSAICRRRVGDGWSPVYGIFNFNV
jgi:hypothetical protein